MASSHAPLYVGQGGELQGGELQGGELQGGELQGGELQGGELQGGELQGGELQGELLGGGRREEPLAHSYAGMTLGGHALENVRIQQGELVAERVSGTSLSSRRVTLRGAQLAGAHLQAVTSAGATLRHRIAEVTPDVAGAFLYRIEQQGADGTWRSWCHADVIGVAAAIPLAAVIDGRANRVESSTRFTFGCTSGAHREVHPLGLHALGHPGAALGLHAARARGLLR